MTLMNYRSNNLLPVYKDFESMMDRFFKQDSEESAFLPAVNFAEDKDGYVLSAELPGVKLEDIELRMDKGVLTLSGEKKSDHEEKDEDRKYYRVESRYGKFVRKVRLPDTVDSESIKASFEDGVLKIRIKKAESAKPRTIAIESN